MKTIGIKYSCAICKTVDREVQVPARLSPDEDVVKWMEETALRRIGQDHFTRMPGCWAKELKNIKIPIDKDDPDHWVGKPK